MFEMLTFTCPLFSVGTNGINRFGSIVCLPRGNRFEGHANAKPDKKFAQRYLNSSLSLF